METPYDMTESTRAYNRWHWIIGIVLAVLLMMLPRWTNGRVGPYGCCAATTAGAAPSVAPASGVPAPAPALPAPAPEPAVVTEPPPAAKVFFSVNRSQAANTDRALTAVVAYLRDHGDAKVSVTGFHDPQGNAAANATLARNRALFVAAALKRLGIADARVVLETPTVTTGSGSPSEARRVEITVHP